MRSSKQRSLILSIVNSSNRHLTAEQIYEQCQKSIPNISLGTVYRDINQLVLNGEINKIDYKDGKYRYDSLLIKHHYFKCLKCGKVEDVYQDFELPADIILGSKVLDYDIYFRGLCNECNKEE